MVEGRPVFGPFARAGDMPARSCEYGPVPFCGFSRQKPRLKPLADDAGRETRSVLLKRFPDFLSEAHSQGVASDGVHFFIRFHGNNTRNRFEGPPQFW